MTDKHTAEIEPCPRCGSKCTVGQRGTDNPEYPPDLHFRIVCQGKKCGYGLEGDTKTEAITSHNELSCQSAVVAGLVDALKNVLAKLPNERTDYSGVGYCAGCGAVLWVSGDDSPRDPCRPGCVLVAARAALATVKPAVEASDTGGGD